MPEVNVSRDALVKVKSALSDYNTDISGFYAKIRQCSTEVSHKCNFEMKKIADEVQESEQKITELKSKIEKLTNKIAKMAQEKERAEKELEASEMQLEALQRQAEALRAQISQLGQQLSRTKDPEAQEAIQRQISQLRQELSKAEQHISQMREKVSQLKQKISELAKVIPEAKAEKAKSEDALRTEQRRLELLKNKKERMVSALGKLNDNMNTLLAASKSFETRATSQTEKTTSSIEKCMDAISGYLSS